MDALPYYKWLWRDWRSNRRVQRMPWQAKGLYRELLDEFWAEGSLPTELTELADICGCGEEEMREWWPHIKPSWEEIDGRLYNAKMNEQRTAKDAERVAKAESGRIGGKASNSPTRAQEKQATVDINQASAKQVLTTAEELQAQPDIAEQSRAEHKQSKAEILAPSANALEAVAATPPAIGTIPLVDGSNWPFSQEDVDEWKEAYPAVDVLQQLREMKAWCNAHANRKKTKRGIRGFITAWLGREQDKGSGFHPSPSAVPFKPITIAEQLAQRGA